MIILGCQLRMLSLRLDMQYHISVGVSGRVALVYFSIALESSKKYGRDLTKRKMPSLPQKQPSFSIHSGTYEVDEARQN
jgi:hypothetical protein